ncbi:hypothetical protein FNYG_15838 [Fusarium nygamai]|uniref:Rhodopsin domain-containing protein n=1 Tax=Gibberella nygamai TaxID=42673 RepID=A0A2K0U405_GIBNY|nr:hypothetical protein FNYG_15838 [Fusarium nygamai]
MAGINLQPVIIEMWTEYAIGILTLCLRIFGRVKIVRWKWDGDDYLAVAALILFTWEVAMCQVIAGKGSITGMTDEIALSLTPEQYRSHETGAKWLFAAWYVYVSLIWSLKGIILFFFWRITKTLPEQRLVKWTSVVVVAAYLVVIGVITGHCWPTYRLWQVYPSPGDDCSENRAKYYALVVIGIICTNAPSIKPLFHRRKRATNSSSNSTDLVTFGGTGRSHKVSRMQRIPDEAGGGSQEYIIGPISGRNQTVAYADDHSSDHTAQYGRDIHVSTEYKVDAHSS